jgi:hypothetical protein
MLKQKTSANPENGKTSQKKYMITAERHPAGAAMPILRATKLFEDRFMPTILAERRGVQVRTCLLKSLTQDTRGLAR